MDTKNLVPDPDYLRPNGSLSIARRILVELVFYVHFFVFLFVLFGGLIPSSWWSYRAEIHFYFSIIFFFLIFIWGAIWTFKFPEKLGKNQIYRVCFLDTLIQTARGYSLWDAKNYEHNFVKELLYRLRLWNTNELYIWILLAAAILFTIFSFYLKQVHGIVLY